MNPHLHYSRDTDAEGQFDPSMPWFDRVRHLFETIPDGSVVLDCGCNSGGFGCRLLREKPHCRLDGVDLADHFLPLATEKGYAWTFHAPAEDLPIPGGLYDFVILSEILEHADSPVACVREARRVLKAGGMLLGDVPTWFGKWGCRSLRGHKWHVRAFCRSRLHRLLSCRFSHVQIVAEPRWPTRHFLLSQWYTFKAWGMR